jgi:hypothetical protein
MLVEDNWSWTLYVVIQWRFHLQIRWFILIEKTQWTRGADAKALPCETISPFGVNLLKLTAGGDLLTVVAARRMQNFSVARCSAGICLYAWWLIQVKFVWWVFQLPSTVGKFSILANFARRCAKCDALFLATVQVAQANTTRNCPWSALLRTWSALVQDLKDGTKSSGWYDIVKSEVDKRGLLEEVFEGGVNFVAEQKP